ncbi:MAG: class II fructose-bisphosphate aldolase [Anaerolineales bacterium]
MVSKMQDQLIDLLEGSVVITDNRLTIKNPPKVRQHIERLVREATLADDEERRYLARFLIRRIAQALDIIPSSIHDLYIARGRGDVPNTFTTPAINLRSLTFYAARAIFRIVQEIDGGAFIFELARSETGYTDQRPSEYAANILGAAIAENYTGPVFLQGDHYQVSDARYAKDPEGELTVVRELTSEALQAGFFNIDIDASTLVDLSKDTIPEQQTQNIEMTALFTNFIREREPEGVTVSIGGEIGEIGSQNSTEEELRAFLDGYNASLAEDFPGTTGLSKISIQTGTAHGGVVLPDGSIKKVSVDFDTLKHLSQVARESYGLGGAVQHGASTLPESAFNKFVESEAVEVHLATNFQNIMFDRLPEDLVAEIYNHLDEHFADYRKEGQTDDQFYYKNRKRALGPYKKEIWGLPEAKIEEIASAWETQFRNLFRRLSIADTRQYVDAEITPINVKPDIKGYFLGGMEPEDTSDLAD